MQKLRIHHLQHVAFETLGMIQDWIDDNQYPQTTTHLYKNETLPDMNSFDVLIILGGPMSVHDEDEISWLKPEKALIKKSIEQNKTVIGICLGAQLIANVLGAKVYKNKEKEIGWFPVGQSVISVEERKITAKIIKLLNNKTVFHWHGETFDLPENTIHLLSSEACTHQAFLYKENVLGLQFHIEMNETTIHNIIENCREELIVSGFIQPEEIIKSEMKKYVDENKRLLFELLDMFV